MKVRFGACVAVTLAAIAAGGSRVSAADVLKVAVGQCGNWDSSPVQLGDGAGIFAKHGITIEAVCTQGTGETRQAVISGGAVGNADFWFVKADSPLKTIKDTTDATTIAYSTSGSSTHAGVLGLIRELGLKGRWCGLRVFSGRAGVNRQCVDAA